MNYKDVKVVIGGVECEPCEFECRFKKGMFVLSKSHGVGVIIDDNYTQGEIGSEFPIRVLYINNNQTEIYMKDGKRYENENCDIYISDYLNDYIKSNYGDLVEICKNSQDVRFVWDESDKSLNIKYDYKLETFSIELKVEV